MTGAQHQALVADVADDADLVRLHRRRCLHAVDEGAVGHLEDHLVAAVHRVDLAEGRQVGGAVTGDPDRPALARERRLRIVAGPLPQRGLVGALDDDHVEAVHVRGEDAPDRLTGLRFGGEAFGEDADPLAFAERAGDRRAVGGGGVARFDALQLIRRFALFDRAVERGERLLVGERDRHLGDQDDPRRDQRDREDVAKAAHLLLESGSGSRRSGALACETSAP